MTPQEISRELYSHLETLTREVDESTWDDSFNYVVDALVNACKIARKYDETGRAHAHFIAAQSYQLNNSIIQTDDASDAHDQSARRSAPKQRVTRTGHNGRDALLQAIKGQEDRQE